MQLTVPSRPSRIFVLGLLVSLSFLVCGNALASSCGVLAFTSGRGVNEGAASNITSLVSSEVDIRGGFGLVLTASAEEVSKDCGKKSSCIKSFGQENDYDRVVSGNVDNLGKSQYRLTVKLWDIGKGTEVRQVKHDMNRSPDALLEAIPALVIELLTGKLPEAEEENTATASTFDGDLDFGDEEDLDFGDEEEEELESSKDTKWMERDRRGRKIKAEDEPEEDPLGFDDLDDLDDLDLDDMTEDSQRKKSTLREERREREAKRKAEEERLEELAREEELRREEERRRASEERRLREQEAEAEREAERRAAARAEAERRERQEREARRQEARERARAEEREDARRAAERERRREEERRAERRRRDQESRDSYAMDDEDLDDDLDDDLDEDLDDEYEDYELEDDGEVIEIESTISLGGGLVMVEDDDSDEDEYFGPEDEEEEELQPGDVVDYADSDYGGRNRNSGDDSSYSRRRRDDDRLAYNDRGAPSRSSEDEDLDLDLDLDSEEESRYSGRDRSEFGRGDSATRSSYSSSRARSTRKSLSGDGPKIAIKAGAGWTAYYPETLSLGMFNYGFEASFFALPWLSVDAGANFWSVSLIEYDDQGNSLRTVRTLPSFLFGATWHGTFHKVIRPYAGIDLGALLYAQAVVQDGDSTQIRPLFAPVVALDIGVDFVIVPNFGVYVGGKFGGSYAARVQETVNSSWDPSTGLAEVWAGALIQF